MRYELHMFLRRIYMKLHRKSCKACKHYDGRFGDDECFECQYSKKAACYEKRIKELT